MKKSWAFKIKPAELAGFIKKYWKETVFVGSFTILILAIFFAVSVTNSQLKEAEINSKINLIKYNVVQSWRGTNVEVVKSFQADVSNVYLALGDDGFLILGNPDLKQKSSLVTNLSINDVAVNKTASGTLAFLAAGGIETPGGLLVCDITDITNIRVINSILETNVISENIKTFEHGGNVIDIIASDKDKGFILYSYDFGKNLLSTGNFGGRRDFPGERIDLNKNIICSVSKTGAVYLFNWRGELLSTVSNALSMANSVYLDEETLIIGDRMGGVVIYNIADPRNYRYIINYNTSGDTYDASELSNSIYIADGINGILKIRREKFSDFTLEKQFNDGAIYNKLYYLAEKGELFAGCGKDGLRILN
jgi:hypothetical protein